MKKKTDCYRVTNVRWASSPPGNAFCPFTERSPRRKRGRGWWHARPLPQQPSTLPRWGRQRRAAPPLGTHARNFSGSGCRREPFPPLTQLRLSQAGNPRCSQRSAPPPPPPPRPGRGAAQPAAPRGRARTAPRRSHGPGRSSPHGGGERTHLPLATFYARPPKTSPLLVRRQCGSFSHP